MLVSAAIQRGASHRIVAAWLAGAADFEVVMCAELLGEVREVLTTRARLRKWISLQNAALFVETIEAVVDLVENPGEVKTETRDPNDDHLIARRNNRGRPTPGAGPATVESVRLDPELEDQLLLRAEQDHTSPSDVIREALRR